MIPPESRFRTARPLEPKGVGRVAELEREVDGGPPATVGIAHTRWATHGGVTQANAHPHLDARDRIAVVHNGIVETMMALQASLEADGVVFRSETDTEVLPHLIRRHYHGDPLKAVRDALAHARHVRHHGDVRPAPRSPHRRPQRIAARGGPR